jgi:hypothetical protein
LAGPEHNLFNVRSGSRPWCQALQFAVTTLTNNGFAITHCDSASATLTGPGLNSTRQNPILGATKVDLRVADHRLHVDAELGGVETMRRFLYWFPLSLGAGLGLLFGVVGGVLFGRQFGVDFGVPWAQGWQWLLVAMAGSTLPVAPWLVFSPTIARWIQNRTQRAIETLAHNATFARDFECNCRPRHFTIPPTLLTTGRSTRIVNEPLG